MVSIKGLLIATMVIVFGIAAVLFVITSLPKDDNSFVYKTVLTANNH